MYNTKKGEERSHQKHGEHVGPKEMFPGSHSAEAHLPYAAVPQLRARKSLSSRMRARDASASAADCNFVRSVSARPTTSAADAA